ncbi:MAG TPA: helix-turn-helix domain-containing protein [Ktedonosporobacter sp.]|nr:helix-turn-helix domain-containing protein [Ktedonosporobacter sp.]
MHKRQKQGSPDDIRPLFLTIPEVAMLLNVGRTTVYGLIQREGLPSVDLGGRGKIRVRRSSLERWLQSRENG